MGKNQIGMVVIGKMISDQSCIVWSRGTGFGACYKYSNLQGLVNLRKLHQVGHYDCLFSTWIYLGDLVIGQMFRTAARRARRE